MGVVYRARDHLLGRVVALKVLRENLTDHPRIVARFRREARITGQLEHPGVVAVYDTGVLADGRPFIAMQHVRGRPLSDLLAARQTPPHSRWPTGSPSSPGSARSSSTPTPGA